MDSQGIVCPIHTTEGIKRVVIEMEVERDLLCIECLLDVSGDVDKSKIKTID